MERERWRETERKREKHVMWWWLLLGYVPDELLLMLPMNVVVDTTEIRA
jgi:hypothetical protein